MSVLWGGCLPPACWHVFLHQLLSPLFDAPCLGCGRPEGDPLCLNCQLESEAFPADRCKSCQGRLHQGKCPLCGQSDVPFEQVFALGTYQGGMRNLVRRLKYQTRPDLGYWLGMRLAVLLEPHVQNDWLVVPVPIHRDRRRNRGYNQTEPMAYEISRRLGLTYRPDLLRRRFQSRPSYQQGRADRWAQASQVFAAEPEAREGAVLLVDDIMTSGATAWEASMELRRSGARSVHLAIAARAT